MPVDRGFVPAYTVQRNAWSRSGMSVTGASFIRPRYQPDCPPGKHAPASRRIHSMQNRTGVLTNGTGTMMDEKNKGRLLAHPGTIASSPGQPVLFHPRFLWSAKARTPMRSGCAAPLAGYEPVGQVADEAGHRRGLRRERADPRPGPRSNVLRPHGRPFCQTLSTQCEQATASRDDGGWDCARSISGGCCTRAAILLISIRREVSLSPVIRIA